MNKQRGQIKVNLGDKDRIMHFSLDGLISISEEFDDMPLGEIFEALEKFDVKVIRSLIYHGLLEDDPDLSIEQVGKWDMPLKEVMDDVGKALTACLGDKKGKK